MYLYKLYWSSIYIKFIDKLPQNMINNYDAKICMTTIKPLIFHNLKIQRICVICLHTQDRIFLNTKKKLHQHLIPKYCCKSLLVIILILFFLTILSQKDLDLIININTLYQLSFLSRKSMNKLHMDQSAKTTDIIKKKCAYR